MAPRMCQRYQRVGEGGQVSWQDCVQCQLLLEMTPRGGTTVFSSFY